MDDNWTHLGLAIGAAITTLGGKEGLGWLISKRNGNGNGKMEWRVQQLENITERIEGKLDDISTQIADLRVEVAERK